MNQFDQASELEELFRTASINNAINVRHEQPDEDEHGRYCLTCGGVIPPQRLVYVPHAVRCATCQQRKENLLGK